MLRDLLSDWGNGKLAPRRFAFLYATIIAGLIAFLVSAGVLAMVMFSDSDEANRIVGRFAMALFIGLLLLLAAMFNITVKRARDTGLPGFVAGIGFLTLFALGGVTVFLIILLALVPSDSFSTARLNRADR